MTTTPTTEEKLAKAQKIDNYVSKLNEQERAVIKHAMELKQLEDRAAAIHKGLEAKRKQSEAAIQMAGLDQTYRSLLGRQRNRLGYPFGEGYALPV